VVVEIGSASEVPEGEARRFVVDHLAVAVANLGDGLFLAVDDTCSHAEASLSEGEVDLDDETIECPRHGSVFDLRTGRPRSLPATEPVRAYRVKLEGDALLVEVPEGEDG
jgi:3-phenylpropionate/trans-cinnamate dioxygenase ferredoxin component